MILPLVQDMINMSAQSLWTRFPQNYEYIKIIAQEKWIHIKIEEKKLKSSQNAMRMYVGTTSVCWLVVINTEINDSEKYFALIHELTHCYIDEIKLLEKKDEEKVVQSMEKTLRKNKF